MKYTYLNMAHRTCNGNDRIQPINQISHSKTESTTIMTIKIQKQLLLFTYESNEYKSIN